MRKINNVYIIINVLLFAVNTSLFAINLLAGAFPLAFLAGLCIYINYVSIKRLLS